MVMIPGTFGEYMLGPDNKIPSDEFFLKSFVGVVAGSGAIAVLMPMPRLWIFRSGQAVAGL